MEKLRNVCAILLKGKRYQKREACSKMNYLQFINEIPFTKFLVMYFCNKVAVVWEFTMRLVYKVAYL